MLLQPDRRLVNWTLTVAGIIILLTNSCLLQATPITEFPVVEVLQDRAPPGRIFKLTVKLSKDSQNTDSKTLDLSINFKVTGANENTHTTDDLRIVTSNREDKDNYTIWTIGAQVPEYKEIFKATKGEWYEGWAASRKVTLQVFIANNPPYVHKKKFGIPREGVALTWSIVTPILFFVLVALLKPDAFKEDRRFGNGDGRKADWAKHSPFKRMALYPLSMAITPRGRYSLSIVQILFWTSIVLFASVYVYLVRGDFLTVSQQILVLLGISGGTALGAKMNAESGAVGRIDPEYFRDLKRTRLPALRNLISVDGIPNIYKFQMVAFTLINGWIVVMQLCAEYNFPEIPTEQLLLIGISNGTYLGNELSSKSRWNAIVEAAQESKKLQANTNERKYADKEVRNMLCDYYGAQE